MSPENRKTNLSEFSSSFSFQIVIGNTFFLKSYLKEFDSISVIIQLKFKEIIIKSIDFKFSYILYYYSNIPL